MKPLPPGSTSNDEASFVLLPDIRLDPTLISRAVEARAKRDELRAVEAEATELTAEVVVELARKGLSQRDIAYIMGISFQRVQQLLAAS